MSPKGNINLVVSKAILVGYITLLVCYRSAELLDSEVRRRSRENVMSSNQIIAF